MWLVEDDAWFAPLAETIEAKLAVAADDLVIVMTPKLGTRRCGVTTAVDYERVGALRCSLRRSRGQAGRFAKTGTEAG